MSHLVEGTKKNRGPSSPVGLVRLEEELDRLQELDVDGSGREQRMDHKRRVAALARMVEVAHEHPGGHSEARGERPQLLIALRHAWFAEAVAAALLPHRIHVLDPVTDGADAVGLAIATRPELVLLEAVVERMSGIEVLNDLQTYAPGVPAAVRVAHDNGVQAMIDAGACAAWVRNARPDRVAGDIAELLRQPLRT